jgi:hypothetical protein
VCRCILTKENFLEKFNKNQSLGKSCLLYRKSKIFLMSLMFKNYENFVIISGEFQKKFLTYR